MTPPSAIHHMLAILAGDAVAVAGGDAPIDGLARLMACLGRGLTPDPLEGHSGPELAPRFVRLTFPGIAPTDAFIVGVATAAGLRVESLAEGAASPSRWLLVGPQSSAEISSAVAHLRAIHRIHAVPFRTVED